MPIIVHDRDAHGDTEHILRKMQPKGVVHCFSGSKEMAREIIKIGTAAHIKTTFTNHK